MNEEIENKGEISDKLKLLKGEKDNNFEIKTSTFEISSIISKDKKYRTYYKAEWNSFYKKAIVIMYNPSKATETLLDKSVMGLINLLTINQIEGEDIGSLVVLNIYPYMSPNKSGLSLKRNKLVTENLDRIKEEAPKADFIIFAWGTDEKENITKKREVEEAVNEAISENNNIKLKAITDKSGKLAKHPGRYSGELKIVDYNYQFIQETNK